MLRIAAVCLLVAIFAVSITRLAHAEDAELVDRWNFSYSAGYLDRSGERAGGSEIMHLVAHRGKLFAANGYWVDSRWGIPPDHQKQSAQVLRLDKPGGQWQVDLDMGKSNEYGLRYMKGNILKSVTFTQAGRRVLNAPRSLLVMSAGAVFDRGGAVSAWVRDDDTGKWTHTLVRHGSNAGGVRWVPRDMQVYRDKVTGEEKLFLLIGNPGVMTGVYDPREPGNIRWSRHTEFPFLTQGSFLTRPLGIAEANGTLLFSVGESLYRRNDGERPTYTEILNLGEEADTDVGGIRGLTTIANPHGEGESILLLWAPGGRSRSQVKRLDPDGRGGYRVTDEASMLDLMSETLDVRVTYTLGAHNMMYPVRRPKSGELVHLIGFQGNIAEKHHLRWPGSALYAGAMFAVRTAEGEYSVHEVNNVWRKGKPYLVSPRAFCLSPFKDGQLYVAGHDSSNKISDDMAWVMNAPLPVALGVTPGADAPPPPDKPPPPARWTKGPIYELRIYKANRGALPTLVKRFREHTDDLFKKHHMQPVGYWLPMEEPDRDRKFVYILKHPSRYEAWKNWTRFSNDRRWRAVLDQPQFKGLLAERPLSMYMTETDYSAAIADKVDKQGGVYELRTYTAAEGKLAALNQQFRDHTAELLKKHDIRQLGYWTAFDEPEAAHTLIGLLHYDSREHAAKSWQALRNDPDWQRAAGRRGLRKPPENMLLEPLDFSPLK